MSALRCFSAVVLAAVPLGLAAQQPAQSPPARGLNIEAVRRAVVTIHALDAGGQTVASGTGFFVDIVPNLSIVATAAHVLEDAAGCNIELSDHQTMRCTRYASDTSKDFAMLRVPGQAPATLAFGSSEATKDGDDITIVSNPLGQLPGTIAKGIVSAQRVVGGTKLFQITAPISHGSSGAPVLNAQGRVIGVVRSTIEAGQALNFATATDAVRNLWQDQAALTEADQLTRVAQAPPRAAGGGGGGGGGGARTGMRQIRVGQTVTGELASGDSLYSDTTYYQFWQFTTTPGREITIDLASDDFDPILILRGLDSSVVNDDGGPGCASRVSMPFPGSGPYTILVNTTSTPHLQTGRFTLSITEGHKDQQRGQGECQPPNRAAEGDAGGGMPGGMRQLRVGQAVTGTLTSSDSVYPDSTYYQFWQFSPAPGRWVTLDLTSEDFDPVVIIRGRDLDSSLVNDDGGPGCASRVVYQFPSAGPYTILVNTASRPHWQTGRFTLSLAEGRRELQRDDRCPVMEGAEPQAEAGAGEIRERQPEERTIAVGQAVQGELTRADVFRRSDSTYVQRWTIRGTAGRSVTIDLESDAFDGYLFLSGPGIETNLQDDDSGGNCNARLTATFPESDDYAVLVNTVAKYATGRFSLSVTAGSKPKSLARCSRSR